MTTGRMEAFSDGVIAIIITIMVLELKVPHEATAESLRPLLPVFLAYVLSYVNIGIYWSNHHHMLAATDRVTGPILLANLHLLFWLSILPLGTEWAGEHPHDALPVAVYGVILLGSGVGYFILQETIIANQGVHSRLRTALGRDLKGKLSMVAYLCAVPLAFVNTAIPEAMYVLVAFAWLLPDRRIERWLGNERRRGGER